MLSVKGSEARIGLPAPLPDHGERATVGTFVAILGRATILVGLIAEDITADELKVDRSFITDLHRRPRSQSVLKAIEALGTSLGMTIVVEGVETAEELAYLRNATGISYAQSFCFSRPVLLDGLSRVRHLVAGARSPLPTWRARPGNHPPRRLSVRGRGL